MKMWTIGYIKGKIEYWICCINLFLCKKNMEEIIEYIDVEMLKQCGLHGKCVDNYLYITDRLGDFIVGKKAVKIKVFMMIYCVRGEVKLELNNRSYCLEVDDLFVSLPNRLIGEIEESPDCLVRIICFSGRFIQRLTQTEKYTWKSFHYLHRNPIKHFSGREKALFNQYLDLIESKMAFESTYCQKEILLYLSSAFFMELIAATGRKLAGDEENVRNLVNQPDFIFKRFVETLAADNGRHRTLEYYADLFCYSPKYMSRIIKRISGKNASKLIQENAIEHIIHELKHSSKSIKEIAADFEFSNVSFFAQYVKKHLGVTPSEFRSNVKADKEVSAS